MLYLIMTTYVSNLPTRKVLALPLHVRTQISRVLQKKLINIIQHYYNYSYIYTLLIYPGIFLEYF